MPTPYKVTEVKALPERRLAVRFEDGLEGEVEIRDGQLYGVFEALKDPNRFAQVHCAEGFVAWPGDLDLAPDAMYYAIRDTGTWILE